MTVRTVALSVGMLLASSFPATPARAAREDACEESLAQAEVAVAQARSRQALWTTALSSLREARTARRGGDWGACVDAAARARALAELGLRQLEYPPERD